MLENYFHIFLLLTFGVILSIILFGLSFFLKKKEKDFEKLTAYECGFNPYGSARKTFDIRFYLIAILFILFDLEAVYLFPWVTTLDVNNAFGFLTMIDFLIELIVGYIYVWYIGALEWY
jgi:NADH-quinone oxidoreductase subunit A